MGVGNTVKAIWQLLQGTTNPDVVALYNNLWQQLEGAKVGSSSKQFSRTQVGNVYFVNGGALPVFGAGDDTNSGLTPANAFLTITHALTQCLDWRNDYIYCFNVYNQDATPIVVNVQTVHVIGVAQPDGHLANMVNTGNTALFNIPLVAGGLSGIEIAGFNMGAGAVHGCVEVDGAAMGLWIHNCSFGHYYGFGGQDGIWLIANSTCQNILIEDCWFWGTEEGEGWLTQYGITAPLATAHLRQCTIRNNYFSKLTTGAISLLGLVVNCVIENNIIGVGGDVIGGGINMGTISTGNLIAHNSAMRGRLAAASTQTPFQDLAANQADNDWMCNQYNITMVEPN